MTRPWTAIETEAEESDEVDDVTEADGGLTLRTWSVPNSRSSDVLIARGFEL